MTSMDGQDITLGNAFEQTKAIYDQTCSTNRKRQPTEEVLHKCMRDMVGALEKRGRQYYFFGGISCQLLAKTPRPTADVDVVIENSSKALPNPHDWLSDEPFFWSKNYSQYVWATTVEEDDNDDNIIYQGRCFVEIDINVAGWGSFPMFETVRDSLVKLPGNLGYSLPRSELLKLKLAGWAEKSRREGPKKRNDIADIVALRAVMYVEGEFLDEDSMAANMKEGLKFWLQERTGVQKTNDDGEWRRIGILP